MAEVVELTLNSREGPVLLLRVQEIDAEAGSHLAPCGLLLPVGSEGIEVVAVEVHHREEDVVDAGAQPPYSILVHGIAGVPTARAVARQVGIFAHRRAADLDPRLGGVRLVVDTPYYARDVVASPLCLRLSAYGITLIGLGVGKRRCVLGITDVIEMDAIDIIVLHYLLADL